MSDDLNILNPGTEVVVLGETITVVPFKFGQMAKVSKHIKALTPALEMAFAGGKMDFAGLFAEGGEIVYELLMLGTAKPRAWFDRISNAEGIDLVSALISENREDFLKKMTPKVEKLALSLGMKPVEKEPVAEAGDASTPS